VGVSRKHPIASLVRREIPTFCTRLQLEGREETLIVYLTLWKAPWSVSNSGKGSPTCRGGEPYGRLVTFVSETMCCGLHIV